MVLCPPKMFFAYGLGNQVYFPMRTGATNIVNQGALTPERIWELWLAHEPTIVMSVPTLFAGMLQIAESELGQDRIRKACRRLRFSVSGGENLPPSLLERWRDFTGTEILDGVGTTEMTHMFMLNRPGAPVPGSSGKLVEGFTAEVLDEENAPVAQGEVGNLHVFGPSAATAYWNKPEKTAAVMGRGGVFTGDKVYEDEEGNFFMVGRSDDMLRVGAIWVSPAEVENALAAHPAVLEAAVIRPPRRARHDQTQGLRHPEGRGRAASVPSSRTSSRTSSRIASPTSSAHAGLSLSKNSRRRPPARSSASGCATKHSARSGAKVADRPCG